MIDHEEVLAALPETILQVDADLRILSVNRPDSPVFRAVPEPGELLAGCLDGDAADLMAGLIESARNGGEAEADHVADGSVYRVMVRTIRSESVAVVVFRDVTSRRNTEKALMRMMRDKSSVLESVGNELRAPLSAVIAYANLLATPDPDLDAASRSAMVEHMTDQAWDLAGIVDDLLAVAHTEIGDLHVAEVPVNLFANTAQVLESMGDRGARITVTGDRSATAVGDPARFRQIARNLLSNALTHGSEPVTVDVRADDNHAVLSVKDRGPGIPADVELSQLLTRTAKPADLHGRSRVGIGLWLSNELADLMGGHVDYGREHGLTVFRVALPLLDV